MRVSRETFHANEIPALLVVLTGWLLTSFLAETQAADLSSYDWSVNNARNLAVKPPDKTAIQAFVDAREYLGEQAPLCWFRFANLRRSGFLSLVATMDDSRRGFCNAIYIVDRTPVGFKDYWVKGVGRLTGVSVKDIAGDGHQEIVVLNSFTDEVTGAQHCTAQWPVIFGWTRNGYSDVSSQYTEYYRRWLRSLKKEISALNRAKAPSATRSHEATREPPDREDCARAEAARAERFLGISRDAGIADAISWARSNDPATRKFAINVLGDMATPEAIERLRSLATDSDDSVAAAAKATAKGSRNLGGKPDYSAGARIEELKSSFKPRQ